VRFSVVSRGPEERRRAVVNGYRWHAASAEIAELVRTAAPWLAYLGGIVVALIALVVLARTFAVLPG